MDQISADLVKKASEQAGAVVPEAYRDAVQPAAREMGTILGRTVRMALAPVRGLVWSWEHAEAWLQDAVEQRLERRHVGPEEIISPAPQLAAGVIRGVQAAGPERDETLRDMFAALLTTAMDRANASRAHPAFAELLAQITPDEARILRCVARRLPGPLLLSLGVRGVDGADETNLFDAAIYPTEVGIPAHSDLLEGYLDNLHRLGLTRTKFERFDGRLLALNADEVMDLVRGHKRRWTAYRKFLRRYGNADAARALELFEGVHQPSKTAMPDCVPDRYSVLQLRVVWASAFGNQFLRATTDARELGRRP